MTTAGVGGALVVIESDTIVKSWSHFTRDYQMSPSIVEDLVPQTDIYSTDHQRCCRRGDESHKRHDQISQSIDL